MFSKSANFFLPKLGDVIVLMYTFLVWKGKRSSCTIQQCKGHVRNTAKGKAE